MLWKQLAQEYDLPTRKRIGLAPPKYCLEILRSAAGPGAKLQGEPLRRLILALLLLLPPHLSSATSHSPIPRLVNVAQVGTDEAFKGFLEASRHNSDLTAPAELRRFLLSQRVLRINMSQGYKHDGSRASLTWWFSEIGVPGKAKESRAKLEKIFQDSGFSAKTETVRGREVLIFSRLEKQGSFATRVRLGAPKDWVGGRETACGFDLEWVVSDMQKSPAPELEQVLAGLPSLRDARIDDSLYAHLKGAIPLDLTLGGSWTRYYAWDVTLRSATDLEVILNGMGYRRLPGEGRSTAWNREATGSYAYLETSEAGRVSLRIQPQS